MPIPLLLALFLAFGFDAAGRPAVGALTRAEVLPRVAEVLGGVLSVAVLAFLIGAIVARAAARNGQPSARLRRGCLLGIRTVDVATLLVFGWIIHEVEWPRVVRSGLAFGDPVLVDDALILLPFLCAQIAGWCGLHRAVSALRRSRSGESATGLGRHLWLEARRSMGLVLPVAVVYALGIDLFHRFEPNLSENPWEKPLALAGMGVLVLALAPALVRIAWPTRPLPAGPLRDRLEHISRRLGFQCTDIWVWDTNRAIVNAGVTGSLPWFRYVFLSDALVELLTPQEVAAVFGHEVGHMAHRHLHYFGFFILSSLLILTLVSPAIDEGLGALGLLVLLEGAARASFLLELGATLLFVGGYFLLVFGFVSRRFERQADVFGCRVASCGRADCPPHLDLDGRPVSSLEASRPLALCPVGIHTFISALSSVAMLNGMKPTAWSWRHGSIARRIRFLEGLIDRPETEQRFQSGVRRMQWGMAALLLVALALAFATG